LAFGSWFTKTQLVGVILGYVVKTPFGNTQILNPVDHLFTKFLPKDKAGNQPLVASFFPGFAHQRVCKPLPDGFGLGFSNNGITVANLGFHRLFFFRAGFLWFKLRV